MPKEIPELWQEMQNEKNLVSLTADTAKMLMESDLSLSPEPNRPLQKVIFFLKGRKGLNVIDLSTIGEKETADLPKKVGIIWTLRLEDREDYDLQKIYVYPKSAPLLT